VEVVADKDDNDDWNDNGEDQKEELLIQNLVQDQVKSLYKVMQMRLQDKEFNYTHDQSLINYIKQLDIHISIFI